LYFIKRIKSFKRIIIKKLNKYFDFNNSFRIFVYKQSTIESISIKQRMVVAQQLMLWQMSIA